MANEKKCGEAFNKPSISIYLVVGLIIPKVAVE